MFSDKSLREKLLTENNAADIHRLISEWTPHVAPQRSPAV
jgi:hypothetical protein